MKYALIASLALSKPGHQGFLEDLLEITEGKDMGEHKKVLEAMGSDYIATKGEYGTWKVVILCADLAWSHFQDHVTNRIMGN